MPVTTRHTVVPRFQKSAKLSTNNWWLDCDSNEMAHEIARVLGLKHFRVHRKRLTTDGEGPLRTRVLICDQSSAYFEVERGRRLYPQNLMWQKSYDKYQYPRKKEKIGKETDTTRVQSKERSIKILNNV